MAPTQLLLELQQLPAQPFRIHVSDGSHYDVRHPEFCMVGVRTTSIWVPPDSADGPDRYVRIDNRHITRLEPLSAPTNPAANGQSGS